MWPRLGRYWYGGNRRGGSWTRLPGNAPPQFASGASAVALSSCSSGVGLFLPAPSVVAPGKRRGHVPAPGLPKTAVLGALQRPMPRSKSLCTGVSERGAGPTSASASSQPGPGSAPVGGAAAADGPADLADPPAVGDLATSPPPEKQRSGRRPAITVPCQVSTREGGCAREVSHMGLCFRDARLSSSSRFQAGSTKVWYVLCQLGLRISCFPRASCQGPRVESNSILQGRDLWQPVTTAPSTCFSLLPQVSGCGAELVGVRKHYYRR